MDTLVRLCLRILGTVILLCLTGAAIPSLIFDSGMDRQTRSKTAAEPPVERDQGIKIDKDPSLQPKRKAFVQECIANKVLLSVDWGSIPKAQVDAGFYLLTFQAKKQVASIIWAAAKYDFPQELVVVQFRDGYSGKKVGEFPDAWVPDGLKIY